jgi:uncharacterized DUF497 family protein
MRLIGRARVDDNQRGTVPARVIARGVPNACFQEGPMRFVWDRSKASANQEKHGITFEEAATVFSDALAITGADPDHSLGEARWITFGSSDRGRLLVVSHTDEADIIRIISARSATRSERYLYEEG